MADDENLNNLANTLYMPGDWGGNLPTEGFEHFYVLDRKLYELLMACCSKHVKDNIKKLEKDRAEDSHGVGFMPATG